MGVLRSLIRIGYFAGQAELAAQGFNGGLQMGCGDEGSDVFHFAQSRFEVR